MTAMSPGASHAASPGAASEDASAPSAALPGTGGERATSLALDPRDQRLVDGAARWMSMLGRFQVLLGGLLLLFAVGAGLALWVTDAMEGGDTSATTPPLVTLGQVEPIAVAAVFAVVLLFGAVLVRGGTLLIDAAEVFERHLAQKDRSESLLLDGMRRLGTYFLLESVLVAAVLAGLIAMGARP